MNMPKGFRVLIYLLPSAIVSLVPIDPLYMSLSTAHANTDTKNIAVNATIANNCNFNTNGGGGGAITVDFGTYDPTSTHEINANNSSINFNFRCNKGTSVALTMNYGLNASGSTRRMVQSGEFLTYELYMDPGRSQAWGSTPATGMQYTATTAAPQSIMIYGQVPAGQDVSIGTYTDTVVITATF